MQVDWVEDIPSILDVCVRVHESKSNKEQYFDCVEPAERCEGDEKNQSACNPFCEWVTFGRDNNLRNSAWLCRRAGHCLRL